MTQLKLLAGKNGVRIRETPVDGKPVGQLYESDVFEALDSLGSDKAEAQTYPSDSGRESFHGVFLPSTPRRRSLMFLNATGSP